MLLLLLFIFEVSASFRLVEPDPGDDNLMFLLEKIHEKLFPVCSTATHFDQSWSNNHKIFSVNCEKIKQRKNISFSQHSQLFSPWKEWIFLGSKKFSTLLVVYLPLVILRPTIKNSVFCGKFLSKILKILRASLPNWGDFLMLIGHLTVLYLLFTIKVRIQKKIFWRSNSEVYCNFKRCWCLNSTWVNWDVKFQFLQPNYFYPKKRNWPLSASL